MTNPDALWIQAAGVDYSAAEDRHLISAMYNPGVISGGVISAGSGLAAVVSAGRFIVDDGAGGAYHAQTTTTTTVSSLTASSVNNLYVVVDPTGATAPTIVRSGTTPTSPSLLLGSAVTSTAAVTSVNNTAARAEVPTVVGRYLPLTGGTLTGTTGLAASRLVVSGSFDASANLSPSAPLGVRLGKPTNPTARASVRGALTTRQLVAASTWTKIQFDSIAHAASDYALSPLMDVSTTTTQGRFLIPVDGDYHFSGSAHFVNQVGAGNTRRLSRIMCYDAAGTVRWWRWCTQRAAGGNEDSVTFDAMMDCQVGQWVEFHVYHDENHSVYLSANDGSTGSLAGGDRTHGAMRLIQAD